MMPIDYDYDDKSHFTSFRLLLATQEDQVLDILKKTYPTTKTSNVVELCSKIIFNIDPRYPTFLSQYGKIKSLIDTYSPTAEEEKMIVESWKKSWDEKILGPPQVKTQLKASLFTQQNMASLEIFMKNLLTTLHERMMDHGKTVHFGEKYDYRPYSRDEKAAANIQKAEKPSVNTNNNNNDNNRGDGDETPNKGNLVSW